jgi:hypothetical protein
MTNRTDQPTAAEDFDANFERVTAFVMAQLAPDPNDTDLCEQVRKSVADAATNAWQDGITVDRWQDDMLRRMRSYPHGG